MQNTVLEGLTSIPAFLHQWLSIDWSDKENHSPLPRTIGKSEHSVVGGNEAHWLVQLEAGVKAQVRTAHGHIVGRDQSERLSA